MTDSPSSPPALRGETADSAMQRVWGIVLGMGTVAVWLFLLALTLLGAATEATALCGWPAQSNCVDVFALDAWIGVGLIATFAATAIGIAYVVIVRGAAPKADAEEPSTDLGSADAHRTSFDGTDGLVALGYWMLLAVSSVWILAVVAADAELDGGDLRIIGGWFAVGIVLACLQLAEIAPADRLRALRIALAGGLLLLGVVLVTAPIRFDAAGVSSDRQVVEAGNAGPSADDSTVTGVVEGVTP